ISCPSCQRRLRLPADYRGVVVRCPSCDAQFPAESALPGANALTADRPAPAPAPPPFADVGGPRQGVPRPAPRPVRPTRPQRRGWRVPGVLVAGVATAFGIWVGAHRSAPSTASTAGSREDAEVRRQEIKAALAEEKPLAAEEIPRELQPLFEDLGAAFRAADGARIAAHFDAERMTGEIAALAPGCFRTPKDRRDAVQSLNRALSLVMAKRAPFVQWTTFEIRSVKKLNPNEAVVIVRHQHEPGVTLKMRWWVIRQGGAWKIYDTED